MITIPPALFSYQQGSKPKRNGNGKIQDFTAYGVSFMIKYATFFLFFLISFTGISQMDLGETPCDYKVYATNHEIADGIEFYVFYISKVDLENENCSYALAEDYYNIAPNMQTNTLCVIYMDEAKSAELNKIVYLSLFENTSKHQDYLDAIQLVFVTDQRTNLWREYGSKKEIENLFSLDISSGITDVK